jgi:hypothetical protein
LFHAVDAERRDSPDEVGLANDNEIVNQIDFLRDTIVSTLGGSADVVIVRGF